jgi:two-component system, NarL family, response regulator NreC
MTVEGDIMTNIVIADDHAIVRQGLKSLIEEQSDMKVVGEAENGHAAVRLCRELSPDVVIMDVTMPDLNGVEATRQIMERNPNARVIVLSMHPDKHIVRECLKAGARGYVPKSNLFDELRRAIEAVRAGSRYLSPQITDLVVADYAQGTTQRSVSPSGELTSTDREVLQLLAEGLTVKRIAKKSHLSSKTVDARRRAIMNKLGITNAADLVKYAIREGLTSVDF